jgi:N6-adenosine-specific RNA methylase IME4
VRFAQGRRFATILADPPWQFTNKTGKVAPEHKRLSRYGTMKLDEIMALPRSGPDQGRQRFLQPAMDPHHVQALECVRGWTMPKTGRRAYLPSYPRGATQRDHFA